MLKFFLFPITHKSMFGTPENKGSPATKAAAAAVASLPEGFTIQVLDASRWTASVENVCSDSMCDIQPLEVAKISLQLDKANKKLKECGYISIDKSFEKNYPKTNCKITKAGIKAFPQVAIAPNARIGCQNLMLCGGLGGMRPNTLVMPLFEKKSKENRHSDSYYKGMADRMESWPWTTSFMNTAMEVLSFGCSAGPMTSVGFITTSLNGHPSSSAMAQAALDAATQPREHTDSRHR